MKNFSSNIENIEGIVKKKKYYDEESGFHILGVILPDKRQIIVKGKSPIPVKINDCINSSGSFSSGKYGLEFNVKLLNIIKPTKLETITSYLTSGIIKGLTKKNALDLISAWGTESINIIDKNPQMLLRIKGIGEGKLKKIINAWDKIKPTEQNVNEIMSFGYNEVEAIKIVQKFSEDSLNIVINNPYLIHRRIPYVEFQKVDDVALHMGMEKNNKQRILAAIEHFLEVGHGSGDCILEYNYFFKKCTRYLNVTDDELFEQIDFGIKNQYFFHYVKKEIDHIKSTIEETIYYDAHYLQHRKIRKAELEISRRMLMLLSNHGHKPKKNTNYKIKDIVRNGEKKVPLSDEQKNAITRSINAKVSIITGGPGTGKTTVLNEILKQLVKGLGKSVYLCAPTGKAAQRMKESTGLKASTIHRLLDFHPVEKRFRVNESSPLDTDVIVIDESSMIDIYLMMNLLRAIDNKTQVIIVGDVNQLASVQEGAVLRDFINSGLFVTSSLTQIFRQAAESKIITNAHAINKGMFDYDYKSGADEDFHFIESKSDKQTEFYLEKIIENKIRDKYGLDPKKDLQILVPQHKGLLGTISLNAKMQDMLNSEKSNIIKTEMFSFKKNDRIIQTVNNYEKLVFNGDSGVITTINEKGVSVKFDSITEEIEYSIKEMEEITPSYCLSIHKSQGSEYPVVLIPLPQEYNGIIDRSLIYTGITRGKVLVVLIGSKEVLRKGIASQTSRFRKTNLKETMKDLFDENILMLREQNVS